ncbi:extracellular solute-binding protein [Gordonia neofelifaecis]|uniref:Extracellular solute-binding protein family 1 protein n=1 Tax=Gordonia neofelifaecis NRRL B-59395 TaxID=644548 RepID=F1YFB3_9ACTN|nr:extracellular solute-binding protein [Gordonia neofelifaecis]EGD56652.1 extracellular solute-binding protein family 1 protein [Gordonia neofelifaecis NRRL B-59395]
MSKGRSAPRTRSLVRRLSAAALAAAVVAPMLASCSNGYEQGVLNIYAPADGFDYIKQFAQTCSDESGGRYKLQANVLPKGADDQRLQLARRLAGNDHTLDLMAMDVVWTAEFANAGWMVPVPEDTAAEIERTNLAGPVASAMWQRPDDPSKRLYATPLWTNTQLLWYRPDLSKEMLGTRKAPTTWDRMLAETQIIRKQGGPSWIMVQAKQYEGLMVWFNSLLASAGGSVLDPNDPSKVTLNDTPAHRASTLKALQVMKAVATAPGHDPSITQSDEGTARLGMETGKAAFEINWPFVWASARTNGATGDVAFLQDVLAPYKDMLTDEENPPTDAQLAPINVKMRKRFDFALFPGVFPDKPAKSTLGGLNLAVASTSQQPELAAEAAKCMTGEQAQKVYAISGGTPPTIEAIYDDKDFKLAYPMGDDIRTQLEADHAAIRPASPQYQAISTLVTATLAPVGAWDPAQMVDDLADQVQKAIDGEGIIP